VTPVGKRFKNAPRFPVEKSYSARMASGFRFDCGRSFLCIFICSDANRPSALSIGDDEQSLARGVANEEAALLIL
jgi:hypothetical protein